MTDKHEVPRTMGQQFGRRSWAEPWKIKMVEPLRMTDRPTREHAMAEAGYNHEIVAAAEKAANQRIEESKSAAKTEGDRLVAATSCRPAPG